MAEANSQFENALRHGGDTVYVRSLTIAAYQNMPGASSRAQIIRLANTMRKGGEQIDISRRSDILADAYYLYRREILAQVAKILPADEHLKTLQYLTDGLDINERPYLWGILKTLKGQAAKSSRPG